jgi:WD40 repeat protein
MRSKITTGLRENYEWHLKSNPTASLSSQRETNRDLQRAKLEGLFDNPRPSPFSKALAYALWGVSYTTIANARIRDFSLLALEEKPIETSQPASIQFSDSRLLDAPEILTDYYVNPLCWGDIPYIGLGSALYSYNTVTNQAQEITAGSVDSSSINALAYQSNSLIRLGSDSTILLIDPEADHVIRENEYRAPFSMVASCGNNAYFISRRKGQLSLYDVRSPQINHLVRFPQPGIVGITFNPCKSTLAVSASDCIKLYDQRKLNEPKLTFSGHTSPGKGLAFMPGGHQIVSGGGTDDKSIQVWSGLTGKVTAKVDIESQICGVRALNRNSFFVHTGFGLNTNKNSCWSIKEDQVTLKAGNPRVIEGRVLFSAQDPSNPHKVVTGGDDETIGFYTIKDSSQKAKKLDDDKLDFIGSFNVVR